MQEEGSVDREWWMEDRQLHQLYLPGEWTLREEEGGREKERERERERENCLLHLSLFRMVRDHAGEFSVIVPTLVKYPQNAVTVTEEVMHTFP